MEEIGKQISDCGSLSNALRSGSDRLSADDNRVTFWIKLLLIQYKIMNLHAFETDLHGKPMLYLISSFEDQHKCSLLLTPGSLFYGNSVHSVTQIQKGSTSCKTLQDQRRHSVSNHVYECTSIHKETSTLSGGQRLFNIPWYWRHTKFFSAETTSKKPHLKAKGGKRNDTDTRLAENDADTRHQEHTGVYLFLLLVSVALHQENTFNKDRD